jgi:hypothetical protein
MVFNPGYANKPYGVYNIENVILFCDKNLTAHQQILGYKVEEKLYVVVRK